MDFDVIVIGAGLAGLTVASKLAIDGHKVGVFEQHSIPGGYATNFSRSGYNFDVSLHGIGGLGEGGNINRILKACNVFNKIEPLKSSSAYSVAYKDKVLSIPNDKEEYKKLLLEMFDEEKEGIEKLFNDINVFESGFSKFILNPSNNILKKISEDVLLFISWSEKTTYEVVSKYVKNEEFIRLFTVLWSYYGLPPKELSATYFFIPWISYYSYGKYYIKGGAQSLSNAFVESITSNGGEVYLNSFVDKIYYNNEVVTGVALEDGREYTSNWVVSNVNPIKTLEMLPNGALQNEEEYIINNHKIGCTLSQLYLGLDCDPKNIGLLENEIFVLASNSHEDDYELAINNNYEETGFLITNYNELEDKVENKGIVTVTFIDNYNYWSEVKSEYITQKEYVIGKIIKRLDKYCKGILNHIVVAELGTPRTMERYTKNPKGAVYGYAQDLKQSGRHRLKSKTSIRNFSFVGAWVNPGGGYEGTISGGMSEAIRISKLII